jgi:hypothetical protein
MSYDDGFASTIGRESRPRIGSYPGWRYTFSVEIIWITAAVLRIERHGGHIWSKVRLCESPIVGARIICERWKCAIGIKVQPESQIYLMKVLYAASIPALCASGVKRRQDNARKERHYGNHYQKLYEGKTTAKMHIPIVHQPKS